MSLDPTPKALRGYYEFRLHLMLVVGIYENHRPYCKQNSKDNLMNLLKYLISIKENGACRQNGHRGVLTAVDRYVFASAPAKTRFRGLGFRGKGFRGLGV